jgi:hypothetical protein
MPEDFCEDVCAIKSSGIIDMSTYCGDCGGTTIQEAGTKYELKR